MPVERDQRRRNPAAESGAEPVYANVGQTRLVPDGDVTSLGSAISRSSLRDVPYARRSAGRAVPIPHHRAERRGRRHIGSSIAHRKLYFALGDKRSSAAQIGDVLPELRRTAARARGGQSAGSAAS